jgi:hypothetical protein
MASLDTVRSRATFREAVVLLRSMTVHSSVPFMSKVGGMVAIIGHTIVLVDTEAPNVSQDWRNEIEADRL